MQEQNVEKFDLNDPRLMDYVPEGFDPQADIESRGFRPPKDGRGWVRLFMRQPTERNPHNPYVKGTLQDASVVVGTRPRIEKEDGTLGAFLADFYPTTKVIKGDKNSKMHFMAKQAGIELPEKLPAGEIIKRVREAFERAGDQGLRVYGRWQMQREVPKVGQDGGPILNEKGYPESDRYYGSVAVTKQNLAEAEALAQAQTHMTEDERRDMVDAVKNEPWKYYEEKDGSYSLREARVVFELQVPPKAQG